MEKRGDLKELIKEAIDNNNSLFEVRSELVSRGFLETDIDEAIAEFSEKYSKGTENKHERNSRIFGWKEFFDRLGFGFVSHQYINILFWLTGASFFLIGIINGLKTIISIFLSSVLEQYSNVNAISKKFISRSGILFGFSFILMSVGIIQRSPFIFSTALILGSAGVVSYGDLYTRLFKNTISKEKLGPFLVRISQVGVVITAAAMLLSGYIMELFPITGEIFTIAIAGTEYSFRVYGYLISFEVTAIAFILSGYLISLIKDKKEEMKESFFKFYPEYSSRLRSHLKSFFKNKYLFWLLVASTIAGLAQILGNSFYGIFIYQRFESVLFGGFLNVAVIFVIALMASVIGPFFTKMIRRSIGLSPMLVFGTLLTALMPLILVYNPNFFAIGAAAALSVTGASITGVAQGLLARKLLNEEERKLFFASLSIAVLIPFLIFIPLGSYVAQAYGLTTLFKIIGYVLAVVVAPLYFVLVAVANKKRL